MTRAAVLATALALAIAVTACGGGGGGADANQADAMIGPIAATGVVRYEDRQPMPSGALGQPMPKPARFVAVALVTIDGQTLGEGTTGEDGTFSITSTMDVPYGDSVHILAATTSDDPARRVEVVLPSGEVHGFGDAGFEAEADHYTEVLVTQSSNEAEAFNVFDNLIKAADYVTSLGITAQTLTAVWAKGSSDGTYFSGGDNTMHLLGMTSDDDGYDDTVILHEAGHWVEDTIGRSDSPGGFHDGSPTDPNLGWSEGFATYWSMAVNGGPIYVDSNAGGGWSYNADTELTHATIGGGIGQDISEDTVTEVLWDLGDAGGTDDDTFSGTHPPVIEVQPDYLRTTTLRAVGEGGVDLVDFLDGFLVADGLTHCAAVTAIVTTAHTFPYDYNGPAGPCP